MILAEEKKKVEVELREVKAREVKAIGSAAVAIVLIPVSLAANLFKSLVGIFSPWVCTDLLCYCVGNSFENSLSIVYIFFVHFCYFSDIWVDHCPEAWTNNERSGNQLVEHPKIKMQ